MIDSILTFFVASWWIIAPIGLIYGLVLYFYKKLSGEDDKPDSNDWWSLFIFIAVVVGGYLYLSNATSEREAEIFKICMETSVDEIKDEAERVAYCFGVMGDG
ncbi:hypothetical protein N9H97_04080 [Gammaproteobacteria bacterium]|jgi:hypothetical protein|nr:hypothetical protein [Gammaproteobacteria bacterium]